MSIFIKVPKACRKISGNNHTVSDIDACRSLFQNNEPITCKHTRTNDKCLPSNQAGTLCLVPDDKIVLANVIEHNGAKNDYYINFHSCIGGGDVDRKSNKFQTHDAENHALNNIEDYLEALKAVDNANDEL